MDTPWTPLAPAQVRIARISRGTLPSKHSDAAKAAALLKTWWIHGWKTHVVDFVGLAMEKWVDFTLLNS